jgi:hypothetical protein
MIQLVNYQMNELSHIITGDDLQNANVFWDTVCNGKLINNITRLVSGENPELRFADGSVWRFSREDLGVTIQIVATEMTDYYLLTNTLKQKNEELEMMSDRLRKYGENVDEYTRTKERLETKVRIHNEMGQALLTTRRTLNSDDGDLKAVLDLWKRNISVLRMESNLQDEDSYKMFRKSSGIDLGTNQKMFAGGIYIGGTHPASNGGAYMSVVYGFCGLKCENNELKFKANFPKTFKKVKFKISFKNKKYLVELTRRNTKIEVIDDEN